MDKKEQNIGSKPQGLLEILMGTDERFEKIWESISKENYKEALRLEIPLPFFKMPKTDEEIKRDIEEPFLAQLAYSRGIRDKFEYAIKETRLNRIDFSGFKNTVDFLYNYCSKDSSLISFEQQKKEILKSDYFKYVLDNIQYWTITYQTLSNIITSNKSFFSIGLNNYSFFRKSLLFMELYIVNQRKVCNLGELPYLWLKALINYPLFSNFKCCIFLNRSYKNTIESNKLASIKYFNDIILGAIEKDLMEKKISVDWIVSIKNTYKRVFGNKYESCSSEIRLPFPLFSRDELDMFLYILIHNISCSETFPIYLENEITDILVNEGISPLLVESLQRELAELYY